MMIVPVVPVRTAAPRRASVVSAPVVPAVIPVRANVGPAVIRRRPVLMIRGRIVTVRRGSVAYVAVGAVGRNRFVRITARQRDEGERARQLEQWAHGESSV